MLTKGIAARPESEIIYELKVLDDQKKRLAANGGPTLVGMNFDSL
jgi:hypothetical protein